MSYARRCLLDLLGPAGDEDGLIDQVEDNRAHREAEKLYVEAEKHKRSAEAASGPEIIDGHMAAWSRLTRAGQMIDPYEMRDGQLVRKSDGEPVNL